MRKLILLGVLAAALVAGTAQAAPVNVGAFPCAAIFGGQRTVPAGSQIIVTQRWEASTLGLVFDFLNAQTTTIAVNGGTPVDVSDAYSAPVAIQGIGYRTSLAYDTGITLVAGESLTFTLVISLSHQLHDGFTDAGDQNRKPLFFGPGVAFSLPCTVTAV